jgi:NADPH:quinone reductase-like Zn-dependent oxidoreductase
VVEPNRDQLLELNKLVDAGSLRPVVARTFPLEKGHEAYEAVEKGGLRGMVVLVVAHAGR